MNIFFLSNVNIFIVGGHIFKYKKGKKTNETISISSLHKKTQKPI